jgi:hypothetical protein
MSEKCALCEHIPACGFATWQKGDLIAYLCHDDDHSCYQRWLWAEASWVEDGKRGEGPPKGPL